MGSLFQDLRSAARTLVRRPAFAAAVVLTLAFGIGANVAVFSGLDAAVLRALPYRDADQLVMVWQSNTLRSEPRDRTSYPNYVDWRDQSRTLADLAAFHWTGATLTGDGEPLQVPAAGVTWNFFAVFGVEPLLGRTFTSAGGQPEEDQTVVLSYRLWQRRYGGDPGVVGRSMTVNGSPRIVLGVMPERFAVPEWAELWRPRDNDDYLNHQRDVHWLYAVGRLAPAAGLDQARKELSLIARRLEAEYPEANTGYGVTLLPLREHVVGEMERTLLLLLGASGLVVLIACANVANLLLSRATGQARELAIRVAVGASRWRIARQLLADSLLLALLGGALGMVLGFWGLKLLVATHPDGAIAAEQVRLSPSTAAFTLVVCLAVALVCGLAPLLRILRTDPAGSLHEGSGRISAGPRQHLLRRALVVFEIALGLVLLIGASLLARSFIRLQRVELGFDPNNLLTIHISLPRQGYPKVHHKAEFFPEAIRRLRGLPGVTAAGASSALFFSPELVQTPFAVEGSPRNSDREHQLLSQEAVTSDYFKAMRVPLIAGRFFSGEDTAEVPEVAIINETLAERIWPGQNPLGKRINHWDPSYGERPPADVVHRRTIVGVVGDMRRYRLDSPPLLELFVPFAQSVRRSMRIVVRTETDPLTLLDAARATIWSMDPELPIADLRTMDQMLTRTLAPRRFNTLIFLLFSVTGLLLALMGIFSVLTYFVSQRTHDLAVRMAFGARKRDILVLVIKQGLALAAAASAIGLIGGWALGRLISSRLYDVSASDAPTYLGTVILVTALALLGSYLPGRRAANLNPGDALRRE